MKLRTLIDALIRLEVFFEKWDISEYTIFISASNKLAVRYNTPNTPDDYSVWVADTETGEINTHN